MNLALPTGRGFRRIYQMVAFAEKLKEISNMIGFKLSGRGWCYQLEGAPFRLINKDQFDKVEKIINDCRKEGYLPVDFVFEEDARLFSGVELPESETPLEYFADYIRTSLNCYKMYIPDWWEGEEYYIQMLVEKIDLKTLFEPICKQYHIPIATSKGWSSIIQRAKYSRRFKEAEENGLKCVLLYCGDHDPDGLRISDTIRENLAELNKVTWNDGFSGYDPSDLIIDRFGLNYDFIIENKLSWIDNLKTGSGGELARLVDGKIVQGKTKLGNPHPNFELNYVQDYLKKCGVQKVEANALVVKPQQGQQLCIDAIEKYLHHDAINRFKKKRESIEKEISDYLEENNLKQPLQKIIDDITGDD
jgi:hypothetical protein